MTPKEKGAAAHALAERLTEIAAAQLSHGIALDGLLLAYAAIAIAHPCCTAKAAHALRDAAEAVAAHTVHSAAQGAAYVH
jgi:hypothetical protein